MITVDYSPGSSRMDSEFINRFRVISFSTGNLTAKMLNRMARNTGFRNVE